MSSHTEQPLVLQPVPMIVTPEFAREIDAAMHKDKTDGQHHQRVEAQALSDQVFQMHMLNLLRGAV